ncbi:hypothetical protein F5Y15DRAFT_418579 [Xylariaceae sp. FL0016]|nr:hypothetical protein F5Y15DRAFT_418579 [Xylariaceae sp. FL0016]
MATAPATAGPQKLSFAKVVASSPKETMPSTIPKVAVPAQAAERRMQSSTIPATDAAVDQGTTAAGVSLKPTTHTSISSEDSAVTIPPTNGASDSISVLQGMKDLNVSSTSISAVSTPSLVVNGTSSTGGSQNHRIDNGTSLSDDVSQRADSNSEMDTKAPSLDGKSITSGTTFALDEKESLRPDDSASVKAAAEDDESFSVRSSMITNSRIGSDVARVHRIRIGDMPERRIVQLLPEAQDQGAATPQSGASSQQQPADKTRNLGVANGTNDAFNSTYGQNPDEKLLEAMQSPKDRIFLLRLEQDVINFVQSSKEPYMDLPPNNSFCRMLTHKLADYYHMTHSFEAVQGAVRIYRTPFCRVPPSLASIVESNNTSETTPPPVVLPKKIMRRGEEGGSGHASTSASKATSEVGSDGKEKTIPREKMTREEREEAYNKARERIFGKDDKQGEITPEMEDASGISRASSVSAREKSTLGKRGKSGKQRREDSESFESRSQFRAYYHPQPVPDWSAQYMSPNMPPNMPYNGQMQQPFQYPMPQAYQAPAQAYPAMVPIPNNGYPQYGSAPTFPPQPQPSAPQYTTSNAPMVGGYGPPQGTPHQTWQPTFAQSPSPGPSYAGRGAPRPQTQGNASQIGIPYLYGQLPANANPHDPKSQHPIPGSYNRHAFNPKTQSFIPSNGMSPVQAPMAPYTNMPGPHGSPQMAYSSYNNTVPPQPYLGGAGAGYGMSRQGSSNSLPPYHAPQHIPQHPSAHPSQMAQMPSKPGMPPQGPSAVPGQNFSHLPNYGNPATLPQKPPTGV